MSSPQLPTPSGMPGSISLDALLSSLMIATGAVITGLIALFGVLYSQRAPLQVALNGAFKTWMTEEQDKHVQLIARISELKKLVEQHEKTIAEKDLEIQQRDGEIRGLKQSRDSLLHLINRNQSD